MVNRRIPARQHAKIHELALQVPRLSAGQIHAELVREFRLQTVSKRTVERVLSEARADSAETWRIEDAETEGDALAVLEVVRDLSDATARLVAIPRDLASWIVRIRRCAPGLDSRSVFAVASIYRDARESGRSTGEIDAWLAFAPWRDQERPSRYRQAVARGLPAFDAAPWAESIPAWYEEES